MMDLETTAVFDAYWKFAAERQRIYLLRVAQEPGPWTDDPILQTFRFTNVYRAADRVSQYLIRDVIYDGQDRSPETDLFRIVLFKIFNKIETWEYLECELTDVSWENFDSTLYGDLLERRIAANEKIYSAAYMMPSGKSMFGHSRKHRNHLELITEMMKTGLSKHVARARSLNELYEVLAGYPMLGRFLAFQLSIDINYSELCDFDESSFVVAGPGAINGIVKCFGAAAAENADCIISLVCQNQDEEFAKRGISFPGLFGRPLQLIDCQNLFCEVDKYSRIAFPEFSGVDGRKRVKRKYEDRGLPWVRPLFPPKWGVNSKVDLFLRNEDVQY